MSAATHLSERRVAITGTGLIAGALSEDTSEALVRFLAADSPLRAPGINSAEEAAARLDFGEVPAERWIAKKSDRRAMGPTMLAGCCAAGLALDRAGLAEDDPRRADTDLIIACRVTERDRQTDDAAIAAVAAPDDADALAAALRDNLRPSLFLAQLPNLLAGNISIVHGITGTSQTFLGNDAAGADAVATALHRLRTGQSERCLVGGVFRGADDYALSGFAAAGLLADNPAEAVWQAGGIVPGSAAAFLLLETEDAARARGRDPKIRLTALSHRFTDRNDPEAALRAWRDLLGTHRTSDTLAFTTASGAPLAARQEQTFWQSCADAGLAPPLIPLAAHWGALFEAAIPAALIAAASVLERGEPARRRALVNGWGLFGGDAMAVLEAA